MTLRSASYFLSSWVLLACSAPGAGADSAPPSQVAGGGSDQSLGLVAPDGTTLRADGLPANLGTELLCDGIDENGNGIIDDVDKGRDGLCDCLSIGFLGEVRSDAGSATAAFENWLEDRSDFPVTKFDASTPLNTAALASLQVLVVGNLTGRVGTPYSASEVEALRAWVDGRGGGLMTLAGFTSSENHMEPTVALLGPTGLGYDYQGRGPGILGVGAPPVRVTGFPTPDHATVEGIGALGVYAAYPVTGPGDPILEQGGFVLARAKDFGAGRVVAFGDEWVTQDRLWLPQMQTTALTSCQQQCVQCNMQCDQCVSQCDACTLQPCQATQVVDPTAVCARGCDQSCLACQDNCAACTTACETCSALEAANAPPEIDVPRFWLNVFRWLAPANECKVDIPAMIR